MRWTPEELKQRIAALPNQAKAEIIYDVAWCLFGGVDQSTDASYIDTRVSTNMLNVKTAISDFRDELERDRPPVTIKTVLSAGELELIPGLTFDEIIELAAAAMNRACTWDVTGEIAFEGSDNYCYVGTVEFMIGQASPAYMEQLRRDDAAAEQEDA